MKIGIISDTHGDLASWQKAMGSLFTGAGLILHAGDVLYHGPRNPLVPGYNPAELANTINQMNIPLIIARGNCDAAVDQLVLDWPIQAPYALIREQGMTILVNHGDQLSKEEMISQARRYQADLFISGHTHERLLEKADGVVLLNPGSCALPKGDGIPSIAVLQDRRISLFNLETEEELAALTID